MNIRSSYNLPNSLFFDITRSRWEGVRNSTIFLPRRFHRPFIFRSNFPGMRLPWECHNQSQETKWRHCITSPELTLFLKTKNILKIDQSVKMPWQRLSMGVACSYSSAPDITKTLPTTCVTDFCKARPVWRQSVERFFVFALLMYIHVTLNCGSQPKHHSRGSGPN